MNNQRVLFSIYLPLTLLLLIFDNIYPAAAFVNYLKYTLIITLFLVSLSFKKPTLEQTRMGYALFFVVLADFFLVFCSSIPSLADKVVPWGITCFMIAYLLLIFTYRKKGYGSPSNIIEKTLIGLLIILVFATLYLRLFPHINGLKLWALSLFGLALCYYTWISLCTVFQGYFTPTAARYIALSGCLMFVSDIAVALSMFDPAFNNQFVPWLKNIIWIAYIPAWTIVVILISQSDFLAKEHDSKSQIIKGCSFYND